jgi:hypothetical protein
MPKKPVVEFELSISVSAARPVLEKMAKADRRMRLTAAGRAELRVRSDNSSEAIAELRQFAEGIKKATRKTERV